MALVIGVSHDFEDELISAVTVCKHFILDFAGVTLVSSAALKTLLTAQQALEQKYGASMVLRNIGNESLKTFQDAGFLELFEIEE